MNNINDESLSNNRDNQNSETRTQQEQETLGQLNDRVLGAHRAATEENLVKESTSDEVESETTTEVTTNTDAGRSLTLQRLVQNWESYVNHGTRNVQIGLQNLSICGVGEGLTRLGPAPLRLRYDDDDPFAPIVLRHTHSSPLQYSASLVDEGEQMPPPSGLDHMRRSSSTPSTSAFRQRSAGSAFGTHLRTMPHLGGPEDRIGSAFSLPMQRSSYASVSDSGVRYYAFDPFSSPDLDDTTEKTSIEVTDLGTTHKKADEEEEDQKDKAATATWGAARRAKSFLSDVRVLKFRTRRSGRENPARPPSTSSSSKSEESKHKDPGDNDTISTKSSANTKRAEKSCTPSKSMKAQGRPLTATSSTVYENPSKTKGVNLEPSHYHQLEPDFDEEFEHYQGVETLIGDSPQTVPSPLYHRFVDDHEASQATQSVDIVGGGSLPAALINVSTVSLPSQNIHYNDGDSIRSPCHEEGSSTTLSHEAGAQSPAISTARSSGTNHTGGHTTHTTSTSATISSGRSLLSTVSETDREVMETNKAGKIMRLHQQNPQRNDGEASIYSASTASTTTNGYLVLAGSPAPRRDGASLPVDRFFQQVHILVAHSSSSNSGGSSSSGSIDIPGASASNSVMGPGRASQTSFMPSKKGMSSPLTYSNASATHTVSSNSADEDPPKFVSYLDLLRAESNKLPQDEGISIMSYPQAPERTESEKDSNSLAQIVGYSDVVFEEAKPQLSNLLRPLRKYDAGFATRPPLSPVKGLRAPDTPPPSFAYWRPDPYSPAYQQLSPPTIVDHRMQPGHSNLSKPYVFRSAPPRTTGSDSKSMMLVSPDSSIKGQTLPSSPGITAESDSYVYSTNDLEGQVDSYDYHRNRTYKESNIEVEKSQETTTHLPVVSPDKGNSEEK